MFKKSNRKFRSKQADSDPSDDEDSTQADKSKKQQQQHDRDEADAAVAAAAASILAEKKRSAHLKVLSFNDECDVDDEFRVKKSKESRRIVKELKKGRKESDTTQSSKSLTSAENQASHLLFNDEIKGIFWSETLAALARIIKWINKVYTQIFAYIFSEASQNQQARSERTAEILNQQVPTGYRRGERSGGDKRQVYSGQRWLWLGRGRHRKQKASRIY